MNKHMEFILSTLTRRFLVTFLFLIVGIASAHGSRPIRGTYEVPVTAEALKPYSVYPVKYKADNYSDIPVELNFPLPSQLLGQECFIQMKPVTTGSKHWKGPNVEGDCELIGRDFQCLVKFNDLTIEPTLVQKNIEASYADPLEIQGRSDVAQLFSTEPIGILRYRLKGKTSESRPSL